MKSFSNITDLKPVKRLVWIALAMAAAALIGVGLIGFAMFH